VETLATTEKDRDTQKFIVKEHVQAEEALHKQAIQVKAVAETTVTHVDLLHDKVQRLSTVEKFNIDAAATFEQVCF
jgi:hypothetical protein